jgi:plasmid stability protein
MPVTLTIKQVPEKVVARLRKRAENNHRSMQGELIAILHETLDTSRVSASQEGARYAADALTLRELWESGKRKGLGSPDESTAIIRKMRDERYGN